MWFKLPLSGKLSRSYRVVIAVKKARILFPVLNIKEKILLCHRKMISQQFQAVTVMG
jgi:hypothetical protein